MAKLSFSGIWKIYCRTSAIFSHTTFTWKLATSSSSGPSKFATSATDLCKAFVSAGTQLFEINNPEVWNFFPKYTQTDPPDGSTLRKNCLPKRYEETLNKIRIFCGKENIWVCIEQRTDACGNKVANVTGVLKKIKRYHRNHFFCHTRKCLQ
jgi:hypothetical protein